ncbi:squalene--hopene cyclase [Terribacillus sp. 179-K 1B1 HS]|uniref:squalene--hopene cyclase n=1 Tax=Terribacillus sp. 179-K 1B1 HS TaxID=3142388 RepID=UPI0039A310AE
MNQVNMNDVKMAIEKRIRKLEELQQKDGSWRMCFEGAILTDCFYMFTFTSFGKEPDTVEKLKAQLLKKQRDDGSWAAYPGERNGNLSATVLAYAALRFTGVPAKELRTSERFISTNGGINKAHFMIRFMLAIHGMVPWPHFLKFPMTALLVPTTFPINFFQFSSYARIHFVPMLILLNKKFKRISKHSVQLEHLLYEDEWDDLNDMRAPFQSITDEWSRLSRLPARLHRAGYSYAQTYMQERTESDGTLYSYASATFFMIYAYLALGYEENNPKIQQALEGIHGLVNENCNGIHVENSTSTVWDTALLSHALQQAGVPLKQRTIQSANHYLLQRQHVKKADWQIHQPKAEPGGWGFSDINTNHPDNDDTSAALRAITRQAREESSSRRAWKRGTDYLLAMQNKDGGWAAFEKDTDWWILGKLPIENAEDAAIDPSTADLTGRVMEFLGTYASLKKDHGSIKKAVRWLHKQQQLNGSWYGRWGVCYLYGTWAALSGLAAVGVEPTTKSVKRAVAWLKAVQHEDGGWGESCRSAEVGTYVDLSISTVVQTAWAVDALIASGEQESEEVQRGIRFLLTDPLLQASIDYPTGIGLPGQFYIRYESYPYIFPLLALSHYRIKAKS